MAQDQTPPAMQVNRIFEQPEGSVSFYSDFTQVIGTGNEVVLQFYETIPGPPGLGGAIQTVRTRLRATISISNPHATNIGNNLLKHGNTVTPQQQKKGEQK